MNDCIFCKIAAGIIPAPLLYEDKQIVAFSDLNPQAPTHVLIIPRLHIATLNELEPEHVPLVGQMFLVAKQIAAEIGIGAGVDCDGQVLVLYDMLGIRLIEVNPPRFVKNFLLGQDNIAVAIRAYVAAVKARQFPTVEHSFI